MTKKTKETKKNKRGRNTKLTQEVQKKIVRNLKKGNTYETAALMAGVSRSTFYNWMTRGENGQEENIEDHVYIDFREAVEEAIAHAEADRVQTILDAAKGTGRYKGAADWRAAKWYLEVRNPAAWGRIDRVKAELEHSGEVKDNHVYEITQTIQVDDEAREHAKQLFRRAATLRDLE